MRGEFLCDPIHIFIIMFLHLLIFIWLPVRSIRNRRVSIYKFLFLHFLKTFFISLLIPHILVHCPFHQGLFLELSSMGMAIPKESPFYLFLFLCVTSLILHSILFSYSSAFSHSTKTPLAASPRNRNILTLIHPPRTDTPCRWAALIQPNGGMVTRW